MRLDPIEISELRHKLLICSADDVVTEGELSIKREVKITSYAKIKQIAKATFSNAGRNVDKDRNKRTHIVTMRFRYDVDITSAAWLYEKRPVASDRWFKVVGFMENVDSNNNRWLILSCRQVTRADDDVEPITTDDDDKSAVAKTVPLPDGVSF